jgi:hypothetical protein
MRGATSLPAPMRLTLFDIWAVCSIASARAIALC